MRHVLLSVGSFAGDWVGLPTATYACSVPVLGMPQGPPGSGQPGPHGLSVKSCVLFNELWTENSGHAPGCPRPMAQMCLWAHHESAMAPCGPPWVLGPEAGRESCKPPLALREKLLSAPL